MGKQPWIHNKLGYSIFILLPPFLILLLIVVFQKQINLVENHYSFYTWLFFIVFIDVAHVYATLFKIYFKPKVFQERKRLYIALPIICFVVGLVLFSFGSLVFWRVLAYVAVFHFVRQQYGFMRLYSRGEKTGVLYRCIDNGVIYAATGYPMVYWFVNPNRQFNWFVENEFLQIKGSQYLPYFEIVYYALIAVYVIKTVIVSFQMRSFNIPKNILILGTCVSWYFGIVYYNDDLVFTMLNVVSHGIPYMALIYFREVGDKQSFKSFGRFWQRFSPIGMLLFYIGFLLVVAFFEEFLWEGLVWGENIKLGFSNNIISGWQILLVPLLSVPQFTHYILDGIIWKRKKS